MDSHGSQREQHARSLSQDSPSPHFLTAGHAAPGFVDEGTSAALDSALASPGYALPNSTRAWATSNDLGKLDDVVLHTDEASRTLSRRLNASAFTVANHIFLPGATHSLGSTDTRQTLRHEVVHAAQNGVEQGVARLINRAPPKNGLFPDTGPADDLNALDGAQKIRSFASDEEVAQYVKEADLGSDAETLAYLERILDVFYGTNKLSDETVERVKKFEAEVFERFPDSTVQRMISRPEGGSVAPEIAPKKAANKAEKRTRSNSAPGPVQQAKLTPEERELAEDNGYLALTSTQGGEFRKKIESLKNEQKKQYSGKEEREIAEIVLIKMAMETELSQIFPGEGDPVHHWFNQHQTNAKFLGKKIRPSTDSNFGGVHNTFLARLEAAEDDLKQALNCGSAKECGERLGIRKIGGLRGPKSATGGTQPSMHVYGLAIDVNSDVNPMLRNIKMPSAMKKENRAIEKRNNKRAEGEIDGEMEKLSRWTNEPITMASAAQLITGTKESLNDIDRSTMTVPEITKKIRWYSDILKQYFALLDDDDDLASFVAKHGDGKSAEEWREIIQQDYDTAKYNDLLVVPEREMEKERKKIESRAKKGKKEPVYPDRLLQPAPPPYVPALIDFHDEMIMAMENNGITWGGRHNTPDIMHFDLRSEDFKDMRSQFRPPKPSKP